MMIEPTVGGAIIVAAIIGALLLSVLLCPALNVAAGFPPAGKAEAGRRGEGAGAGRLQPGPLRGPKDAATTIANDLRARCYEVVPAGVRSAAAADVSGCGVTVASGPIYGGVVSNSTQSYLKAPAPRGNAQVGGFAIGSSTLAKSFPDAARLKATALFSPAEGLEK